MKTRVAGGLFDLRGVKLFKGGQIPPLPPPPPLKETLQTVDIEVSMLSTHCQ